MADWKLSETVDV